MNRLISAVGALLVLTGCAILAYVGISYARQVSTSPTVVTTGRVQTADRVKKHLPGKQVVAVPKVKSAVAGDPAVRMVIPRIRVDAHVVQTPPSNGEWVVADWSVGHLTTTPNPGNPGNGAYAAHDDIKGELFKRLGELKQGDQIFLYTKRSVFRYSVLAQAIVDPSDVSVLNPTKKPTVTLISCTPYWVDTQRLIVQAVLKSSSGL